MKIKSFLSELNGLPLVRWVQRRAVTKLSWAERLKSIYAVDPEYGRSFEGIKIIEEEITLAMAQDNEGNMLLLRNLTKEDLRDKKTNKTIMGYPMQEVRGFVLEIPPQPFHSWTDSENLPRTVPVPTGVKLDIGGGELIYIGQHLDHTGSDMPRLRRVLQEMFVDHPIVREWQARFSRELAKQKSPYPTPASQWIFGPTFSYGEGKTHDAGKGRSHDDDDVI